MLTRTWFDHTRVSRRAIVIGAWFSLLSGCGQAEQTDWLFRYRLTLVVDTPEGQKTGSSVIEVHAFKLTGFQRTLNFDSNVLNVGFRGEAVAVDLGPRGVLFALLKSVKSVDWASSIAFHAFAVSGQITRNKKLPNPDDDELTQLTKVRGTAVVTPDVMPILLRFTDKGDPKSAEIVEPDDLARAFGEWVKLSKMTVTMTDDPVTTGIEKVMPELHNRPDWDKWRIRLPYGSPLAFVMADFKVGVQ